MKTNNLLDHIGNTPLLPAERFTAAAGVSAILLAKCECFNPGGSVKDRIALSMIEAAEDQGLLFPGGTIIEPTSGNTGIGLALVAAQRGYRLILTMPESMSMERRKLLKALGAELVLTKAADGMQGAVEQSFLLAAQHPLSFIPNQFNNPANVAAHYFGTGEELWRGSEGKIDILVAGIGSGGTITGCGMRLKELNPEIKIVGVEPAESPLLTTGRAGAHGIQGIGANFIPSILKRDLLDEVLAVRTEHAINAARLFAQAEGLTVGISSGAALQAALDLAMREENEGKTIVAILPDGGERYMSTDLFLQ